MKDEYSIANASMESLREANAIKDQAAMSISDPTMIKIHIDSCITSLRDEDGRCKSRELSLAVTKLQEATMWIDEHLRLS